MQHHQTFISRIPYLYLPVALPLQSIQGTKGRKDERTKGTEAQVTDFQGWWPGRQGLPKTTRNQDKGKVKEQKCCKYEIRTMDKGSQPKDALGGCVRIVQLPYILYNLAVLLAWLDHANTNTNTNAEADVMNAFFSQSRARVRACAYYYSASRSERLVL